jgi:transcriptional regulator PpsR
VLKGSLQQCVLSASAFRQDRQLMALVRVRPVDTAPDALVVTRERAALLEGAEALNDAVVVTEADGRIVIANGMFLELAQLAGAVRAIGEPIERWLGRPGVDMALMIAALGDRGLVAGFPTVLQSEFGSVHSVEVSASVLPESEPVRYVFGIRDIGPRMGERAGVSSPALDRGSVEHLTELVGRVPLKEIVRETDDLIERMCIETALELSNDNRAMAAEMLGLSRQSLYVKMRRFGIGDLDGADGSA